MSIYGKRLRVVMVTPNFPLVGGIINGGIEGAALYLCQELNKHEEIDLNIIVPFAPIDEAGLKNVHNLKVYALAGNKSASFLDPFYFAKVRKAIERLAPDVVHFQGVALWSKWYPLPNVVTVHGIAERDVLYKGSFLSSRLKYSILRLSEGMARKKIHNVIAISPYVKIFLANSEKQLIWDIPNPVADEYFMVKRGPVPQRIFSASHIAPIKNIKSLIKAFAAIVARDPRAELRLAGAGQDSMYGRECRALAESMGLQRHVNFLGSLPSHLLSRELSQAACFALCSYQENAPLSVSEAMASGVPIVASNVGGLAWMVEDGHSGKLVNPRDVSSIASGLEWVLFSGHSDDLGRNAKHKAEAGYRSAIVAQKTIEVYRQLCTTSVTPSFKGLLS